MKLELHSTEILKSLSEGRDRDRRALLEALRDYGLSEQLDLTDADNQGLFVQAVKKFVGKTGSKLMMFQLEDLCLHRNQMNLPGTTFEHPNWSQLLASSALEILEGASFEPRV